MRVFYHEDCLLHNPPSEILYGQFTAYLEAPLRIKVIKRILSEEPNGHFELSDKLDHDLDLKQPILKVHDSDYLDYLESAYAAWVNNGGDEIGILPDTFPHISFLSRKPANPKSLSPIARAGLYCYDLSSPITKDTFKSTLASLRVTLTAANRLALSPSGGVFALCRPPGHHAMPSLCGGYCFINNVAVAARFLQDLTPCTKSKIAILDIDYHHGNGTQEIFYENPSVLYVSLHAENDYPYFTGSTAETGNAEGEGFNINFPLPKGTTDNDKYCSVLIKASTLIKDFDPAFLIVSLGVDTHIDDPICEFKITTDGYSRIGNLIGSMQKPTLFVMEGGYHLESIGHNVCNVLIGFQDQNLG